MWELKVTDFGPIKEARVKFRPLTIFIGANNTGKSYMAQLAYALRGLFLSFPWYAEWLYSRAQTNEELESVLAESLRNKRAISLSELPAKLRQAVEAAVEESFESFGTEAHRELERCFGASVGDLLRAGARSFSIQLSQDSPLFRACLVLENGQLRLSEKQWDQQLDLKRAGPSESWFYHPVRLWGFWRPYARVRRESVHYLPAARSGILHGHKALASFAIRQLPRIGIESFEIPRLSGVVADFLGRLLEIGPERRQGSVTDVAEFLENEVCGGEIDIERADPELPYPEFHYKQNGLKLPLHRTSSMVSEIAPIVLFLRYVVRPKDLVIIEEPEAHLHPDHQLSLARAVARLVRREVMVVVTTHSDYLLHKFSNLVQKSRASLPKQKVRSGGHEALKSQEVSVYLFKARSRREGSTAEELKVTETEGIPQDEFVRVAEELYDETVDLERRYSKFQ
ncbi:MAG TPA: AAA family ATPase [Bryobacteraceae bacterium]|nr:AAA family ATPase [Bryobacteraceae bacterium]